MGVLSQVNQDSVCFETKVEEDKEDVLILANGGVVEITSGYLGYLGYRKDAILFKSGNAWKIWIQGKRVYQCDVIRQPYLKSRSTAEVTYVSEMKGQGSIILMLDGSLLEVDAGDEITSSLWIAPFDALLLDGHKLVNLDDGDSIEIRRLR